jgi:hypothetical protein
MRVNIPGEGESVAPALPDLSLRPSEAALAAQVAPQLMQDVEDYIAIGVQITVNPNQPGAVMPMRAPSGEVVDMVVVPLMLTLPFNNLRQSRVLLPNGQMPDPLMGMLPILEARLVLPKTRLRAEVLAAIEGKPAETP